MKHGLWLLLVAAFFGCGPGWDPVGTYGGDAQVSGQFSTVLTAPDATGNLTTDSTRVSQSRTDVEIVVRRDGPGRLTVVLDDGCTVPVEQSPSPNEHNAELVESVSCDVEMQGYEGPIRIGSAGVQFRREGGGLDLSVAGALPAPPDADAPGARFGSYAYTFYGRRDP